MVATADIQLKSGMRCAKIMLLIVTFMFTITAVLLIMIGCGVHALFYSLDQFIDDHFFTPASLLVAIGFISLFVSTLGAYGAIKESCLLINLYGAFLVLVLILEVSASIAAFVMKDQVTEMLEDTMQQAMRDYQSDKHVRERVDFMQSGIGCCGFYSPYDWRKYSNVADIVMENGISVPQSCCSTWGNYYSSDKCGSIYRDGCFEQMDYIISQSSMLIATGAATVAFVQLLGAICAFMLSKALRRHKSLREARRWQLQQNLDVLLAGNKTHIPATAPETGYAQLDSDPVSYTPNSPSVIN